ncbi:hypothetical protein [Gordonia phthalatica]|uniref:Beta-lactamase n=1 Tax=Gordonia phthalatica TaxID=1136941 RepID=A0A0N9NHF2_9ACTN|nr:hypothetical protein [Gordonia phthalatica]ALG85204.1 hypothetical protein ACH46_12840 [Gordonia phthalatica]
MGRHGTRRREPRGALPRRRGLIAAVTAAAVVAAAVTAVVLLRDDTEQSPASPPVLSEQELRTSFDALKLPAGTGLALVPVGASTPILLGETGTQNAWSVIKVPLALAAERKHGMSKQEMTAVVDSDNASARILTKSLGSPADATAALSSVLREGRDTTTVLPTAPPGVHPHFGETRWAPADAAVWTAQLPCMLGSEHVLSLMTGVAPNQRWGLMRVPGQVSAKGGWGIESDGGYLVRQIGVITRPDGARVAASISAHRPRMAFRQGTATLDRVGDWLTRHVGSLPGGDC